PVTGLTNGATYHYRVVAQNAGGTAYGPDQTVTLHGLAVSGNLYVHLRASNASAGTATWGNAGTLGDFTEVGDTALVQNVGGTGIPGVQFDGATNAYIAPAVSPVDIIGSSDRSIETWVYNPSANQSEEAYLTQGRRGWTRQIVELNYGNFYSAVHWGDDSDWS